MTVLFITSRSLGGSGKHIAALAAGLGPHVRCELAYYPSGVAQDAELEAPFASVHRLPRRPSFDPTAIAADVRFTSRLLAGGHYEAVHTHTSLGGLIGRLAAGAHRDRLRVIHTLHACGADEFTPAPQKWLYWAMEKALDRVTDRYVSPTFFTRDYGRRIRLIDPGKARVIPNSLPLPPHPGDEVHARMRQDLRQALGVAAHEVLFLFCGRLERQKGVDVLLDAASRVPPGCAFKLVLCGTGALEPALREQARAAGLGGRVVWAGWQDDVHPYYAAADVFVMPSRWETSGLVFLEAMDWGLPILATRTQAVPELVEDRLCGLLSPSEDAQGLARNMHKLATRRQLRERLGEGGRSRVRQRFSYERFLGSHLELYRDCRVGIA